MPATNKENWYNFWTGCTVGTHPLIQQRQKPFNLWFFGLSYAMDGGYKE
jgi:hypothetical protein